MSSVAPVLKACGDSYVRLFDHRPAVSSEINYMLQEFETRRNDRELKNCRKMLTQCHESLDAIDIAENTLQKDFPQLIQSMERCTKACQVIANQERDELTEPILTEKARERSERWQKFLAEQSQRVHEVDSWFEEEKKKLEKTYKDLENKLYSSV